MSYISNTPTVFSTGYVSTNIDLSLLFKDSNYIYNCVLLTNTIYKTSLTNGGSPSIFTNALNGPISGVFVNNTIYILHDSNDTNGLVGKISTINQNGGGITLKYNIGPGQGPCKLITDNTYIYVIHSNTNFIGRIDISSNTYIDYWFNTTVNSNRYLWSGFYYNNNIYISDDLGYIHKINISVKNSPSITKSWAHDSNSSTIYDMTTDGTYIYSVIGTTNINDGKTMSIFDLSSGNLLSTSWLSLSNDLTLESTLFDGHTIYLKSTSDSSIYTVAIQGYTEPIIPKPIICFLKGSKILTYNGYIPIESLNQGDLVKTLDHEFVPICMIGYKEMYHPNDKRRLKDQLYKCSTMQYPELLEDLIITGCHSILIDEFKNNNEMENTIGINGDIYVTDGKYRLPACVDERTTIFEKEGNYTIYHLALENDDYYMNYGIYANGLLVETCSKRFLNEYANMNIL